MTVSCFFMILSFSTTDEAVLAKILTFLRVLLFSNTWVESLDLLVGQCLYAKLVKKVDNSLFVVTLNAIELTVLVELWEGKQVHKEVPESLIIGIVSLGEDRLIVELYNTNGEELVEQDNNVSISPICPLPVVRKNDYVYITYTEGAVAYVQRSCDSEKIESLLNELFEMYDLIEEEESQEWKIGMLCCVKSSDGNWYRGRIINGPDFTVRLIDYGNLEHVDKAKLRKLDEKYYSQHEFALEVLLTVEFKTPDPQFLPLVENEEFRVGISKNSMGNWIIDATYVSTGERLSVKLAKQNLAIEKTVIFEEENQPIGWDFTVGKSVQVIVSHVDTPTMFWIHLKKHMEKIEAIQSVLAECDGLPSTQQKIVAALYDADQVWYRAVDVGDGETVRFIDYGNTDIVKQRKPLPDKVLKPEGGYAIPVYLCVEPVNAEWDEEAIRIFEEFIENDIEAKIVSLNYRIVVDLLNNGKSLADILIQNNFGTFTVYTPKLISEAFKNKEKVFISYLDSVNNFYIQEDSKSTELVILSTQLNEENNWETLNEDDLLVGELVCAQFAEDDSWYRAKIISKNPLRGNFIDYGNVSDLSQPKRLPDNVKDIPNFAIHCSLNIGESEEINEKFHDLNNMGETTPFEVIFIEKGEPNIVELRHYNGNSILMDILPQIDTLNSEPCEVEKTIIEKQKDELNHENKEVEDQQTESNHEIVEQNTESNNANEIVEQNAELSHGNGIVEQHTELNHEIVEQDTELSHEILQNTELNRDIIEQNTELNREIVEQAAELNHENKIVEQNTELNHENEVVEEQQMKLKHESGVIEEQVESNHKKEVIEEQLVDSNPENGVIEKQQLESPINYRDDEIAVEQVETSQEMISVVNEKEKKSNSINEDEKVESNHTDNETVKSDIVKREGNINSSIGSTNEETDNSFRSVLQTESSETYNEAENELPTPNEDGGSSECFLNSHHLECIKNCLVSHAEGPSVFYVQTPNSLKQLESLTEKISLCVCDLPNLEPPFEISSKVIAKYPEDDCWYRSKVTNDNAVLFIDYGNSSEVSEIKRMPESLVSIPELARRCSLKKPKHVQSWSEKAIEKFMSMVGLDLEFELHTLSLEDPDEVDLFLKGQSISDELSKFCEITTIDQCIDDVANATEKDNCNETDEKIFKGLVTHYNNLNDMYIQKQTENLKIIADDLEMASKLKDSTELPKIKDVKLGDIISAYYPEKEKWCRGRVINVDQKTEVNLIDWGKNVIVTEMRHLAEKVAKIQPQCTKVRILRDNETSLWPDDLSKKVKDLLESNILNCTIITPGQVNAVKIYIEGTGDVTAYLENLLASNNCLSKENDDEPQNSIKKRTTTTIKKEKAPKVVKSIAQIKASAKSKIFSTPPKKSPAKTETKPENTKLKRSSGSFEDQIIPGCLSGNIQ